MNQLRLRRVPSHEKVPNIMFLAFLRLIGPPPGYIGYVRMFC